MTYGGNLLREVWLQFYFLIFAVGGLITYVLWGCRSLSVLQLRMLELVLFGGMFLLWAGVDAFIYPQFHLATPPVWFRFMMANAVSLPWALMIILYGIFIPNTWPRCAAVVGIMAFTPIVISTATGLSIDVAEGYSRWKFLIGLAAWMAIASAMAIYGSHRIETLRQQVLAARRLGQYQLKQRLGAGGMGEVYLAEHVLLRRPCALKLIRPERAGDAKYLRRFEREVQATAALTHPNTVQVFDYGHAEDGTFYFAMEYLPGLTLQELVDRHGPVPAERAVHLLRQVCGALAEAHAAGLIHRDVKPANVIVCNRGGLTDVAKLLDFGLVRSLNSEAGVTLDREVTGTPTYMSPEQAAGGEVVDAQRHLCGRRTGLLLADRTTSVRRPDCGAGARRPLVRGAPSRRRSANPIFPRTWRR